MSASDEDRKKWGEYRERWREAAEKKRLFGFPLHLDIEASAVCNLSCDMCFQNHITAPKGNMGWDLYKRIMDEGSYMGLCAAKLQLRGEAFLNPEIFDFIRYAKIGGILDVQITTNGVLLDSDKMRKVIESGLDMIIFSIDNSHLQSLHQIRDDIDVVKTVRDFIDIKNQIAENGPSVRIQTYVDSEEKIDAETAAMRHLFPRADAVQVNRFWNSREFEDSFDNLHTDYDFLPCRYLWQRLAIFWNGDVTLCCRDYNGRLKLGNVSHQSVGEIWNGEKMNGYRRLHLNGDRKRIELCKHCDMDTVKAKGLRV